MGFNIFLGFLPYRVLAKLATSSIRVYEPVGNIGAVFDSNMNMSAPVSKIIRTANFHLRNIGKIRRVLNTDTTKSAIVSLVTSCPDYSNGLLCGVTDELLYRLQKVQNIAARVVSGSKKYFTFHQF